VSRTDFTRYNVTMREISISSGEHDWPFSKGLIVESLLNASIQREPAIAIARRVEQRLLDEQRRVVSPSTLKILVTEEARAVLGPEAADTLEAQTSAFEDIVVIDGNGRIPFSKGILSRSLELAGLPIKDAYELSKEIELTLRLQGITRIEREGLEARVTAEVERHFGSSAREAYLERYQRSAQVNVLEERSNLSFPYSKGILAQSLMATGLSPVYAHRVAREVELKLFERGESTVNRADLREVVLTILRSEVGNDVAERYDLLRSIRRPNKPLHILIGGVTGTGKSVLAAEVAYRLGITRIESTDSVRQVMRAMISKALIPALHASSFDAWMTTLEPHEAAELSTQLSSKSYRPSKQRLLEGFRDQVSQVTVGLRAIIERASDEHTSMLIEGVHIVPGFLPIEAFKDSTVVPMVIVVRNEDEHRKRFYSRDAETSQQRPMGRYLEHFEGIRALQEYVEHMARTVGVPVIEAEGLDSAVESAIEVISKRVLASRSETKLELEKVKS
jgi:2-phosphoglycerate kinase